MMRHLHKCILFAVAAFLTSCNLGQIKVDVADCPAPPPPPQCKAEPYSTVMFDTTRPKGTWTIEKVQGASTNDINEWGIVKQNGASYVFEGTNPLKPSLRFVEHTRPSNVKDVHFASTNTPFYITHAFDGAHSNDASIASSMVSSGSNSIPNSDANVVSTTPLSISTYWDGHPTVHGNVMVFASDRPGGIGGSDLWYSVRSGNAWSNPINLGPTVNTICDEISPQFASNGKELLFSSAGHATAGGYDVFTSDVQTTGSTNFSVHNINNIGLPVNTPADEIFPAMIDEYAMTYSSNQESAADFDVYVVYSTKSTLGRQRPVAAQPPTTRTDKPGTAQQRQPDIDTPRATIVGTVREEKTQLPVANAQVTARDSISRLVLDSTHTDSTGTYRLQVPVGRNVEVTAQSPNMFYTSQNVTLPKDAVGTTTTLDKPLALPLSIMLRVNFPTSEYQHPYAYTLDSNGYETSQTWEADLDLLAANVLASGSELQKLVLIGHTDDVDSDEANLTLGSNRVKFIISELVKRGVPENLLEGRSAGERLKPNKRKGESIDQWRKRSRRVELVKVMHR